MFIFGEVYSEVLKIASDMKKKENDYYFYGKLNIGFIIVPDSMADGKAYTYYAKLLNENGYTVIIANPSLFMRKEDYVAMLIEKNPDIEKWYVIGHAQGGWAVSKLVAKQLEKLKGIAFLASYIHEDISNYDISVIRILGSRDKVMNPSKKNENLEYLPEKSTTMLILGGNYQGFIACDFRGKDGEASITWKEQQERSVKLILEYFGL